MRSCLNKNIESYARVFTNFFTLEECDLTVKDLQGDNIEYNQRYYYDPKSNSRTQENDIDITYSNTSTRKVMMERLWYAINTYINDLEFRWFDWWSGYSELRYNKYSVNSHMRIHADHNSSLFDGQRKGIPILSIVGLLNDDFEGGQFIMWDEKPISLSKGDIIVFPSNFLYPHNVTRITSGTRYSFVSWIW